MTTKASPWRGAENPLEFRDLCEGNTMSFIRSVLVLGLVSVLAACGQMTGAKDKAAPVGESETAAPAAAEADATASPQQPLQAATPAVSRPPEPAPAAAPPRVEVATTDEMPSVDIEVYFDFRSHAVTPRAEATLVVLGKALSDQRLASAKFMIAGHTDAVGSATYNRELSERRAASVRRFLIERFGIDGSRLVSRGFGFDKLKVPARPKAVENRRVQIVNLTASAPR